MACTPHPGTHNIIVIKTIIGKLHLQDSNHDLVMQYTNGRTGRVSEMSPGQAKELIEYLNQLQRRSKVTAEETADKLRDANDVMRKKIISKCREMEMNRYDETKKRMVANMPGIEAFVSEHWHKSLNDYDSKELAKIISVIEEKWLPWFYSNKKRNANG